VPRQPLVACARALLALLALGAPGAARAQAPAPDAVPGLVAWYAADTLALSDGEPVRTWPDASGHGHDLTDDRNGAPALLRKDQIEGRPVVLVQKANSHSVGQPFTLGPHTLFLVAAVGQARRALFRADGDPSSGLLLDDDKGRHVYQSGGTAVRYSTASAGIGPFALTVLGREGAELRAFVGGNDVSSGDEYDQPIRVGKFFHLRHTTYVSSDGDGLRIAEMLFYDRWLTDAERAAVSAYLAGKYGLELAGSTAPPPAPAPVPLPSAALARLGSSRPVEVNAGAAFPWNTAPELDTPFRFDPATPTRLYCAADARVRLYVALPLESDVEGASVRVLFRRNGAEFLPGEGRSGLLSGEAGRRTGSVQAEIVTRLAAGDYVEVLTVPLGAAGRVTVPPAAAVLLAEIR